MISTAIGSSYLVIGALLGQANSGHGHGDVGHITSHSGHPAQLDSGHGAAHGDISGHTHAGHASDHGLGNNGSHSAGLHPHLPSMHEPDGGGQQIPILHDPPRHLSSFVKVVLRILSPFSIALFLAFFGVIGLMSERVFPALGDYTALIALALGWILSRQVLYGMTWITSRMFVTTVPKTEEIIGQVAEVCLPISAGSLGEVTYKVHSTHLNTPARAAQPDQDFQRGAKVMIKDLRDNIAYVEPLKDLFLEAHLDKTSHN
jgi:hypothetical protein